MVFKKGHKSHAFRLLGILLGVMASIGMIAYFINSSTEQTNQVSFKAAGVKYKEHFTFNEVLSLPDVHIEEKQRKNMSSSTSMRNDISKNTTYKNNLVSEAKQGKKSANSMFSMAEKQPVAKESKKISTDLHVLSSFDCVKSIPTVLLDYISNTFLNEYGRSYDDFHSLQKMKETVPLLKHLNINCGIDQNCSTLFQYNKQYGLDTTADKTYNRKEIFYCCPSFHNSIDETTSNVCKRAQSIAEKSVFRESKTSTFLGRVNKLVADPKLCNS